MTTLTSGILSGSILQEQMELEESSINAGVNRYRAIVEDSRKRGNAAKLRPVERFIAFWFPAVIEEVKRLRRFYLRNSHRGHVGSKLVAPIIIASDPDKLAAIAIGQAFNTFLRSDQHQDGSPIVMHRDLSYSIGKAIIAQLHADELSRNHKKAWKTLCNRFANITPGLINTFARKTLDEQWFNKHVCLSVGSTMCNIMLGACVIEIEVDKKTRKIVPAFRFYRQRRYIDGRPRDFRLAEMHPRVIELIERGHSVRQSFRPIYLPMVVAPYPWMVDPEPDQEGRNGQIGGGYIKIRTPFTTRPSIDQREAMEQADLSGIYEGVNAVSSTAYKINSRLIDIVKTLYRQNGGGVAGLPLSSPKPLPPKPIDIDTNEEAKKRWKEEAVPVYGYNAKNRGARVEMEYKIELAERFASRQAIYYPHQIDFRGRAYPIPVHLNFHSDDVARAMVLFAEPKPLTERGFWWLTVHAANCFGVDKLDYEGRRKWVVDNLPRITECASDPIKCQWWMEADKPFQFLTACMGLLDDDLAAHIPVQVDGSCNGLQHYAALGRDRRAASAVNLIPAAKPSDVYSAVLESVRKIVSEDATNGNEQAQRILPILSRSVVKQPVMTSVYGVTSWGAKDQILERLKEAGLDEREITKAAWYLSKITMRGIGDVCQSAGQIMAWLQASARKIVSSKGGNVPHLVRWTSPLGFPVVQPDRRWKTMDSVTVIGDFTVLAETRDAPVDGKAQINGVAPNFVHSIDSAHMMRTAIRHTKAGNSFAQVHDMFASHANSMDELSTTLRETFVEIHRQPLLTNLANEWRERYHWLQFDDPPMVNDWDVSDVLTSEYAFS